MPCLPQKNPSLPDRVALTGTLPTWKAGVCLANLLFCQLLSPWTVTLYSLPPQDMEVCADELKNILNTVVNKREWL